MPDLGVEWPDLGKSEPIPDQADDTAAESGTPPPAEPVLVDDDGVARRYRVTLAGIDEIEASDVVRSLDRAPHPPLGWPAAGYRPRV